KRSEKEGMVLAPGGWRPMSTIHHVEPGHHISGKGGRLRKIHTASGQVVEDYGKISTGPADKPPRRQASKQKAPPGEEPYPDNGWIVDAQWNNTSSPPISYFSTEWVVPP